jgi:hypothetical protein
VGDHAAAAADPGIVEQQMDLVSVVALGDVGAKPLDLRRVGDIGKVRRDAQALGQPRRRTEPLGFRHPLRRDIAHRYIAGLGDQLADELPPHPRTAAGHHRDPAREFFHLSPPLGSASAYAKLAVPLAR